MALIDIWRDSREQLESKHVQQIITFAGSGKLLDGSPASKEFREFLVHVPSQFLTRYADQCLNDRFEGSGLALQDVVNQIGRRLGFAVSDGWYRGGAHIGFDGIWRTPSGHAIVVEVKTTDAYRLDLDSIAGYRRSLIKGGTTSEEYSSVLMVVGREDTGGLEAQVRGSRHAWDIRLISVDALLRLLKVREDIDQPGTATKIQELLIPKEFTKLDEIVDLVFSTTEDVHQELRQEIGEPEDGSAFSETEHPLGFHELMVGRVGQCLGTPLLKQSRTIYASPDGKTALVCAVSRAHVKSGSRSFWFGFHTYHREALESAQQGYLALGCGSPQTVLLIPFVEFAKWLDGMNITREPDRMYWHISIYDENGRFVLHRRRGESRPELTGFLLT